MYDKRCRNHRIKVSETDCLQHRIPRTPAQNSVNSEKRNQQVMILIACPYY